MPITDAERAALKASLLELLATGVPLSDALEQTGVSRRNYNRWKLADAQFAADCDLAIATAGAAPGLVNPQLDLNAAEQTTRLRRLQADKLELELKRTRGLVLDRLDVEEILQEVLNRLDKMDGEANWIRLQRLYDVPYDESRDYWVGEIAELTDFLNRWLEDRSA